MGYISDLESSEFDSDDYAVKVAEVLDKQEYQAPFDMFDIHVKQVKHYTISDVRTTDMAVSSCKPCKKCKLKPRKREGAPRLKKTDHRAVVY